MAAPAAPRRVTVDGVASQGRNADLPDLDDPATKGGMGQNQQEHVAGRLDAQRLDKWLWFARVVKSRTQAARLVEEGHVRLNGARMTAPARPVSRGDVLTIALERQVRVLRIAATGHRRGPFTDACLLFDDLSAPSGPCA